MSDIWKPSVTVAAVIERDGRFLLVEEETSEGIRFNQPAGHLDPSESLEEAVIRETLEETAHDFTPQALVGIYIALCLGTYRAGYYLPELYVLRCRRGTTQSTAGCRHSARSLDELRRTRGLP